MSEQTKRTKTYWTPPGKAYFPKLSTPDMGTGDYRVPDYSKGNWKIGLRLDKSLPSVRRMIAFFDDTAAKGAKMGTPKQRSYAKIGYNEDKFADTNEVLFTFKRQAGGTTKAGKEWFREIPVVDENMVPVPADGRNFWSGSIVKVLFSAEPFFKSSEVYGVTHTLEAVMLIDPIYGGGPDLNNSEDFGDEDGPVGAGGFEEDDIPF